MAELKPTEKSSVSGICKNCNNHIREKLVEILVEPCCGRYPASELADYLIEQGVTVQECGEWQREEQSPSGVFWFECSECHTKWGYGAVLHMKYCPNCGAKMKPLLPPKGE